MITRQKIASIKIAQKDAGLDDQTYRDVLRSTVGVSSCTDPIINDSQVPQILKAIRAAGETQKGWHYKQRGKFRQYAKFAGMTTQERHTFLYETVGLINEESALGTQAMFDEAMAEIEAELELRISQGLVAKPAKIKLTYWRDRRPGTGKGNSREFWKIREKWNELKKYLDPFHHNDAYLLGIASHAACRRINSLEDLRDYEALHVIEALKDRIKYEKKNLEQEVPF